MNLDSLVFLDESGANIAMARTYARAPTGERAHGSKPFRWGENITMLGAIGLRGFVGMMTVNGGTTGNVFRAYVDQVLVPNLRTGDVVILDNLGAHKVQGVQEAIESVGAGVLYLPPYSPDFNPIEQCWSKLKTALRTAAARSRDAVEKALVEAMGTVTRADIRNWFAHCGYA